MTRILNLPEGVSQADPWPYAEMPATMPSEGRWTLLMDASGNIAVWPTDGEPPESLGMLAFWSHDDRDLLDRWLTTFCRHGYDDDPERYPHQDGYHYIFNWVCGTLAQLSIASQVAHAYCNPAEPDSQKRWDSAWAIGRAFDDQIATAHRAAAEEGRA